MTEQEWLHCSDPTPMLEFLQGKVSDRKLRLFAVESVRHVSEWVIHPDSKAAVQASEQVGEGVSNPDILAPIHRAAWDVLPLEPYTDLHVTAARAAARTVQRQAYEAAILTKNEVIELHAEMAEEKVTTEAAKYRAYWIGKAKGQTVLAALLRDIFGNPFRTVAFNRNWLTPSVTQLAAVIYDERQFDRLPVLADALEDAACTDAILAHCRQPGQHARGCWVVDLVTGKE